MKHFKYVWCPIVAFVGALAFTLAWRFKRSGSTAAGSEPQLIASEETPSGIWTWKDDGAPLPPPFNSISKSQIPRAKQTKEQRAKIVFNMNELMNASDYTEVLESLVIEDPEYAFSLASSQQSFPALVMMRCYFAKEKDFEKSAGKLQELQNHAFWKSRLGGLIDEVWTRPEATKSPALLSFFATADPKDTSIQNKIQAVIRKKTQEDLPGALKYVGENPNLAGMMDVVTKTWAEKQPLEALKWAISGTLSGSGDGNSIKTVARGILNKGDPVSDKQLFQTLKTLPEGPVREKILEDSLLTAIDHGKPDMWIEDLKALPPSPKKEFIAHFLSGKLHRSGYQEADWPGWFQSMGVSATPKLLNALQQPPK
jgi:hypothetical protein